MDEIERLQVLLIPSIERSVCFVQETERRFVVACEAVMKVDQTVVVFDVLIERVHDVPVRMNGRERVREQMESENLESRSAAKQAANNQRSPTSGVYRDRSCCSVAVCRRRS